MATLRRRIVVTFEDDGGLARHSQEVRRSKQEAKGLTGEMEKTGRAGGRAGNLIKVAFAGAATLIGTQLIGALGRVTKQFFGITTAAEETAAKFRTTFHQASGDVDQFIADFGRLAGLTVTEGREITATLGAMSRGFGLNTDEAADFSVEVVRLAADLASFNNASIEDTLTAIRSGLIGEQEPLRRYGILLSAATVEQEALSRRTSDMTGDLTEQEKVMARLSLAYQQAGIQVGDLVRTQDSLANITRRTSRDLRQHREEFARRLNPAYQAAIGYLNQLLGLYSDSSDTLAGKLADAITDVTRDFIEFIEALRTTTDAIVRLTRAFNELEGGLDINLNPLEHLQRELELVSIFFDRFTKQILQFRRLGAETAALLSELTGIGDPTESRELAQTFQDQIDALNEMREATARLREERAQWRKGEEQIIDMLEDGEITRMIEEQTDFFVQAANATGKIRGILERTVLSHLGEDTLAKEFSPEEIEKAQRAIDKIAQAQELAAAATDEERRLMSEIFDIQEEIAELEAQKKILGEEAVAHLIDAAERRLRLARQELSSARELREAYRAAANAFVEAVGFLQRAGVPRGGLGVGREGFLESIGFTGPQEEPNIIEDGFFSEAALRSVGITADEIARIKRDLAEAAESGSAFEEAMSSIAKALRAVVRMVDVFGDLSDEVRQVTLGIADVADNISDLENLTFTGASILKNLPSIIGAAAGLVSVVAGVVSAVRGDSAERRREAERQVREMRRLAEALEANRRAYERSVRAIFEAPIVGGEVSRTDIERGAAIERILRGSLRTRAGGPTTTLGEAQVRQLLRELEDLGLADGLVDMLENLLEQEGQTLAGAIQNILVSTGLFGHINDLAEHFGEFSDTVEGGLKLFDVLTRKLGQDLPSSFDAFIDHLLSGVEGLDAELVSLLEEARGLDLTTTEGRARLHEIAAFLLSNIPQIAGGLSPDEIEQIADLLLEASQGRSAGEVTRGVQIARSITEVQANELVVLQEETVLILRGIHEVLGSIFTTLALDRIPTGAAPLTRAPGDPGPELTEAISQLTTQQTRRAIQPPSLIIDVGGIEVRGADRHTLSDRTIDRISQALAAKLRARRADPFQQLN